jgi:glycosyltransferase involved in cell wall biosynthesis
MAALYSGDDVFVDSSDFQGFGRCGLEAMACGTACVLSSAGGVGEYARNGDNALLVEPGQPDAFATAVMELLDSESLRSRLTSAARETARAFDHKREARETREYFAALTPAVPADG